jgi:hypothetical protein
MDMTSVESRPCAATARHNIMIIEHSILYVCYIEMVLTNACDAFISVNYNRYIVVFRMDQILSLFPEVR